MSNKEEIQFQKKRELGDIFSDSFTFIKEEIRPVMRLVIIYVLPFLLIYGILQAHLQTKMIGKLDLSDTETMLANIGPFYLNLILISLFSLFVQSLLAGTYYTYIEAYVKKGKGNFHHDEITPTLFSNTLLALGANIFLFIVVLLGLMMCILPGIYLANSLSLVLMVIVFEKKGISNALSRSWKLVHNQWWNTFLISILGVLMVYIAGFISSIPLMLITVDSTTETLQAAGMIDFTNWTWIFYVISAIVSSLFYIVPYTFLAFQYFNLDERNPSISQD